MKCGVTYGEISPDATGFESRISLPLNPGYARRQINSGGEMYENYKLCETLKPKEICLIVEQYREGIFERKYHEHVPKHRLSETALQNLLMTLVLKFENNEPRTIVRSHLNARGKEPPAHKLAWHVAYPEPGVLRKYCGTDTHAWADQVIRADKFRK